MFADNESQLAHLLRRLSFGALPRLAVNKVVTVRGTRFTRTQEVVERSEVSRKESTNAVRQSRRPYVPSMAYSISAMGLRWRVIWPMIDLVGSGGRSAFQCV